MGMLGKSERFIELLQAIEAAARCDVRVLLEGQSGTGKELIARAVHQLSARNNHPFVAIDCGAIPEHLIESELFGYMKGAFTGATQDHTGLIEEAHRGTLFMDEISNLPFGMQAKLLRILQEGDVRPVGSNKLRKVDVRIIATCSASLRKLVDNGKFREDLYYRLHVYPIDVPSLKERKEDIPLLANHFLKKFAGQQQKQTDSFQGAILSFMRQRQWAGNIRELENFVERMVTFAPVDAGALNSELIPPDLREEFEKFTAIDISDSKSLNERLKEQEEIIIRQALEENNWNQTKAAHSLKISEQLIRYRMKKLGVTRQ
jgi:transcriptional regulator with PAS, ATPase and Fis domain